jgi:ribonuclease E
MTKRMLIDATHPEETRVAVVNGTKLEEYDFETVVRKQLKSNIYLVKVSRVEPSLQACFVDFGGNRHGFLPFPEIHPDYYRIPIADREALLAEERALAAAQAAREDEEDAAELAASGESIEEEEEEGDEEENAIASEPAPVREISLAAEIEQESIVEDDEEDEEEPAAEEAEEEGDTLPEAEEDEAAEASAADAATGDDVAEAAEEKEEVEIIGGDVVDQPVYRSSIKRRYKIQEVIKRGQVMLIQISKEERGNKGAAVTSYISLPGRYCVLMPNSPRGGGVSRKVNNARDRQRLKKILHELNVPEGMSVILRTAGVARTTAEIKRDLDYLLRLWDQIRELTLKSSAPALIYEEGNLIKRAIRDLYKRDIDEVHVAGEEGYRGAREFMNMLMPSHVERVQQYTDESMPLFFRYQVETQIDAIHNPTVHLKSGGYIVINPTEAMVSIDVNSGRATKGRHIEETALKTNLEAADEIARQLRLRDQGGLVVIDFIDMEDNRNNRIVERRMREAMQHDRARIQLGRISTFGLMELSRQRLHPSLVETNFEVCRHCAGAGIVRTIETTGVIVLRAIEEEGLRGRASEIKVSVPTDVALYIFNNKREHLAAIEKRHGMKVYLNANDALLKPNYTIDVVRAAGYVPAQRHAQRHAPVSTVDISDLPEFEDSGDDSIEGFSLDEERGGVEEVEGGGSEHRSRRDRGGRGRDRDRGRGRNRGRDRGRDRGDRDRHAQHQPHASAPAEGAHVEEFNENAEGHAHAGGEGHAEGNGHSHEGGHDRAEGEGRRRRGRRGGRNRGKRRGGREGGEGGHQGGGHQAQGHDAPTDGGSSPSLSREERRQLPDPANQPQPTIDHGGHGQDDGGGARKGWWKRITDG